MVRVFFYRHFLDLPPGLSSSSSSPPPPAPPAHRTLDTAATNQPLATETTAAAGGYRALDAAAESEEEEEEELPYMEEEENPSETGSVEGEKREEEVVTSDSSRSASVDSSFAADASSSDTDDDNVKEDRQPLMEDNAYGDGLITSGIGDHYLEGASPSLFHVAVGRRETTSQAAAAFASPDSGVDELINKVTSGDAGHEEEEEKKDSICLPAASPCLPAAHAHSLSHPLSLFQNLFVPIERA